MEIENESAVVDSDVKSDNNVDSVKQNDDVGIANGVEQIHNDGDISGEGVEMAENDKIDEEEENGVDPVEDDAPVGETVKENNDIDDVADDSAEVESIKESDRLEPDSSAVIDDDAAVDDDDVVKDGKEEAVDDRVDTIVENNAENDTTYVEKSPADENIFLGDDIKIEIIDKNEENGDKDRLTDEKNNEVEDTTEIVEQGTGAVDESSNLQGDSNIFLGDDIKIEIIDKNEENGDKDRLTDEKNNEEVEDTTEIAEQGTGTVDESSNLQEVCDAKKENDDENGISDEKPVDETDSSVLVEQSAVTETKKMVDDMNTEIIDMKPENGSVNVTVNEKPVNAKPAELVGKPNAGDDKLKREKKNSDINKENQAVNKQTSKNNPLQSSIAKFGGSPNKKEKGMFKTAQTEKCAACEKTVYAMEKLEMNNHIYHKNCFKCSHCSARLTAKTFSMNEGVIYCVNHFKQLFARKGNYDEGFGRQQYKKRWQDDQPPEGATA